MDTSDTLISIAVDLTADAIDPQAFSSLDPCFLEAIGALAGAQMQTARYLQSNDLFAGRR